MYGFLHDLHVPGPVVAAMHRERPDCPIYHVAHWREGGLSTASDREILAPALEASIVVVSFDVNTIPALVHRWLRTSKHVPRIAVIARSTMAQNDIGSIARGIVALYDDPSPLDSGYPIVYLRQS